MFDIELNGVKMHVEELKIPKQVVFLITFSSERKPIVITRTTDGVNRFWTSVPEGRQKEAEGVGKLIEEYISKNQQ